jgi:hypothetical protein
MNDTENSHPPGPTVPAQLKSGDRVNLTGPNARVCSGLYVFKFYQNGTSVGSMGVIRSSEGMASFDIHASFEGDYEIKGHCVNCGSGEEYVHSFGHTHIVRTS